MHRTTSPLHPAAFVLGLVLIALLASASVAGAGQGILDPRNTCTANNCGSVILRGAYDVSANGDADCFQTQIYTSGDECVRLHVVAQDDDLALVLACPGGSVWRDDDSGGGVKPLIKAETFTPGWCTVQVCHFDGAGQHADFRLRYGRYDLGNRNCEEPTPSLIDDDFFGLSHRDDKAAKTR